MTAPQAGKAHVLREIVVEDVYRARDRLAGARVLDIGANRGIFAAWALIRGAASVVAVEPSPVGNGLDRLPVTVVRAALAGAEGDVPWSDVGR